jgi:hypothetical protein
MTLAELTALTASGQRPAMEVHGLTPTVYVVYHAESDRLTPLSDGQQPMKFPSRAAAQRALRRAGLERATFVHRSAYGEMIGLDGSGELTELRETIHLSTDA